jgi:predicted peptidase
MTARRVTWILMLLPVSLLVAGCGSLFSAPKTGQNAYTFGEDEHRLHYLLFLPAAYRGWPWEKWPLILFLHGSGERGDSPEDLELVKKYGPPGMVETDVDFPFIVLSPQCPSDSSWRYRAEDLEALLDEVVNAYRVDKRRIYVTGLSMGGYASWNLALRDPDRYAAIVPIAGGYIHRSDAVPDSICDLKELPVWAFHGAMDELVSPRQSEILVDALLACGGDVQFTLYPTAPHDSWTKTYENPELYSWLLSNRR